MIEVRTLTYLNNSDDGRCLDDNRFQRQKSVSGGLECRKATSADRLQKVVCRGIQPSIYFVGVVGTDSRICIHDDGG